MSILYITPHFSWGEAACHDGTPVPDNLKPNARRLAETLELIRVRWNAPLVCVSWYRTDEYNEALYDVQARRHARMGLPYRRPTNSQHTKASAVDLAPVAKNQVPILRLLIEDMIRAGQLPDIGGVGVYPSWIHLDVRKKPANGHIARWGGDGHGAERDA